MRVSAKDIANMPNVEALNITIDGIVKQSRDSDDPIFLSDLLVDWQTTEPLMGALREDKTPKYYLRVLRDRWGNPPRPGDVVRRKHKNPLKTRQGKPIGSKIQNTWKRSGTYDQNRYYYTDYVVDDKGCIKVSAEDAEHFLTCWGIHSISKMPMSFHTMAHSVDPAPCPAGGKLVVWYYRYMEVDKDMYKALPKLKGPFPRKRGIDVTGLTSVELKQIEEQRLNLEDWWNNTPVEESKAS